jgi:hypothetical protein
VTGKSTTIVLGFPGTDQTPLAPSIPPALTGVGTAPRIEAEPLFQERVERIHAAMQDCWFGRFFLI